MSFPFPRRSASVSGVSATSQPVQTQLPPGRLISLDLFRGATIAAMMLVNNPGDWTAIYPPLRHAEWHGWTFTDTIFPFFLWIVGVAIPLSLHRRLDNGQTPAQLLAHAFRRSLILFALGVFLNAFSLLIDTALWQEGFRSWLTHAAQNVRIPGVLQRIAVCYFLSTVIYLHKGLRGTVIAILALLALYWALMLAPAPGFSRGSLEPQANFSQYVDNLVLNGPVIGTHVYKPNKTWDPEGIISTLPAIASCLFGVLAGILLRSGRSADSKCVLLFVGGNLLLLAGLLLHPWLPINKNLWTSTYAIFMAGLATNCFAVCFWIADIQGWRRWTKPFVIFGLNAITVFVASGLLGRISLAIKIAGPDGTPIPLKTWLYSHLFLPFATPETSPLGRLLASPQNASLMWAIMYLFLLYALAWVLYRKNWFLRF